MGDTHSLRPILSSLEAGSLTGALALCLVELGREDPRFTQEATALLRPATPDEACFRFFLIYFDIHPAFFFWFFPLFTKKDR